MHPTRLTQSIVSRSQHDRAKLPDRTKTVGPHATAWPRGVVTRRSRGVVTRRRGHEVVTRW